MGASRYRTSARTRRARPASAPRYIEEQTGRAVLTGRDHVGARLATGEDATALHIEVGAAVLHGQNWFYDAAGEVIEYGQYRSAGERLRCYDYRVED
ncbi:MAG: UTRA domain-containing protein [Pseudonocardia sp.]